MRILLTDIGKEYSLNPDQMYAFASEYGGYALKGDNVDNATIPFVMKRHLVYDFIRANKKQDWRKNLVRESLQEFLNFKKYNDLKQILESTGDYWPGYSDDGTADSLSTIRHKTSKIQNAELKKKEKEVLSNTSSYDAGVSSKEKNSFFQKWMYANMILTSLQDGFFLEPKLVNKALDLYTEIINDPRIDEYLEDTKNPDYFKDSIELILTKLSEKMGSNGDEIYAPGFLDRNDEDRIRIDKRFDKYYG